MNVHVFNGNIHVLFKNVFICAITKIYFKNDVEWYVSNKCPGMTEESYVRNKWLWWNEAMQIV
jgi:hypothetical protein